MSELFYIVVWLETALIYIEQMPYACALCNSSQ